MFALQLFLMIFVLGLFGTAGILVAYDVYMATRLRCLLQRTGHAPVKPYEIGEAAQVASRGQRCFPIGRDDPGTVLAFQRLTEVTLAANFPGNAVPTRLSSSARRGLSPSCAQ